MILQAIGKIIDAGDYKDEDWKIRICSDELIIGIRVEIVWTVMPKPNPNNYGAMMKMGLSHGCYLPLLK